MKPWMTEDDIVRSYHNAVDQGRQARVLAELNACRVGDILAVLHRKGVAAPTGRGRRKSGSGEECV